MIVDGLVKHDGPDIGLVPHDVLKSFFRFDFLLVKKIRESGEREIARHVKQLIEKERFIRLD